MKHEYDIMMAGEVKFHIWLDDGICVITDDRGKERVNLVVGSPGSTQFNMFPTDVVQDQLDAYVGAYEVQLEANKKLLEFIGLINKNIRWEWDEDAKLLLPQFKDYEIPIEDLIELKKGLRGDIERRNECYIIDRSIYHHMEKNGLKGCIDLRNALYRGLLGEVVCAKCGLGFDDWKNNGVVDGKWYHSYCAGIDFLGGEKK